MFRSLALSLAVLSACAANARADLFFGTGTVQTSTNGATTALNINQLNGDAQLGAQFINNTTTNAFPAPGSSFNTLGSNLLSTYGIQGGGAVPATFNGTPVVAVFALQGNAAPGGAVITAISGTVALYSIPTLAGYNQFNPTTWGATTAGGAPAAPIATFTLRAGEQGIDKGPGQPGPGGGGPGAFNFTAGQWNTASITLTVGALNSGPFSFNEGVNPNFWNQTGNPPLVPPGSTITGEGIGIIANEALLAGTATNTQFISGGAGTPGFDALNTIFNALLPGASPFGFATNFGGLGNTAGPGSNFNPSSSSTGSPNTADSIFGLGTTSGHFLAAETGGGGGRVPEPATLAVFAGMMGFGGLVYRKRRTVKA